MKYIIHIGQSKTGTSSLQSFLANNRKALRSKGILYPDVFMNGHPLNILEHNALAEKLAGFTHFPGLSVEEYFRQFEEQAGNHQCHTIILSAESFFGTPQIWRVSDEEEFWHVHRQKVQALSQSLGNDDVTIIAYLRQQSSWFESAVSHIIRVEGLLEHKLYESDEQLFELLKPHMNYLRILDLWRQEFSLDSMKVAAFDTAQLKNKNIIDDFCEKIAFNPEGLTRKPDKENTGLDRRYIWLKNRLNKKAKSKAKERVIIDILSELSAQLSTVKKYQISDGLRQKIDDFYAPGNNDLVKLYGMLPFRRIHPDEDATKNGMTAEEKQAAIHSYYKMLYSLRFLTLYMRYSTGAFLRKHIPALNVFLKKFIR